MQELMLQFSESALADADILLYVTDVIEKPEKNADFLDKVAKMTIPVILLINKIDESNQETLITLVEKVAQFVTKSRNLTYFSKKQIWY